MSLAFVLRRFREERRDIARHVATKIQVRELRALASEDALTGLANRRALLAALTAATASPPVDGQQHAFFLIDLNDFKRVNDLHGHALGDRVLQVVTQRFRTAARPSDILARLGGDEFAVLSYNVDRDTAYSIGLRFIATLETEIRVGGHSHQIGASVGVRFGTRDPFALHKEYQLPFVIDKYRIDTVVGTAISDTRSGLIWGEIRRLSQAERSESTR